MKIARMVTINNAIMIIQSCHEKGVKNIQNRTSLLDWSGTIIWRLDSIYGWVKSTNFNRSLVIVKSATTPSTSYDHACNIHLVKTNGNIIVQHIINQSLINPRCMLYKNIMSSNVTIILVIINLLFKPSYVWNSNSCPIGRPLICR
mgnify:FL=1